MEPLFHEIMAESQGTHFELQGCSLLRGTPIWSRGQIRLEARPQGWLRPSDPHFHPLDLLSNQNGPCALTVHYMYLIQLCVSSAAPWVSDTSAVMCGHCSALPWGPGVPACLGQRPAALCPLPSSTGPSLTPLPSSSRSGWIHLVQ